MRASQGYQATSNGSDLQNAQLAVEQAQLGLEDAQDNLTAATLTSPIGGVVLSRNAQTGSKVPAAGTLLTLIDDSTVELDAQVDETQIAQVQVGQTATVTLDAFPDRTFTGTVTACQPRSDASIQHSHLRRGGDAAELRPRPAPRHDRRGGNRRAAGRQRRDAASSGVAAWRGALRGRSGRFERAECRLEKPFIRRCADECDSNGGGRRPRRGKVRRGFDGRAAGGGRCADR